MKIYIYVFTTSEPLQSNRGSDFLLQKYIYKFVSFVQQKSQETYLNEIIIIYWDRLLF